MIKLFQAQNLYSANDQVAVLKLGKKMAVAQKARNAFGGYRQYKRLIDLLPNGIKYAHYSQSSIFLSGDYTAIKNTYDPFDAKTQSGSGLIYYPDGKDSSCSIRSTRCFSFSGLNANSLFRTHAEYTEIRAGGSKKYCFRAKGKVDFRKGIKYALPLVDPSAVFLELEKPKNSTYRLFKDPADNLFIEFDSNYHDQIEYDVGTIAPLEASAFADPRSLNYQLARQPSTYRIRELETSFRTYADLVTLLQEYFASYNSSCHTCYTDLESQATQGDKIAYMVRMRSGSCRHRAFFAYLIVASTGIETRYVISRTHAWIECLINGMWRYVDLGGCPVETDIKPDDAGSLEPSGAESQGEHFLNRGIVD
jgi:hypothetical protein